MAGGDKKRRRVYNVIKGCPVCFHKKTRTGHNVPTRNYKVREQYRDCLVCGYKWVERYRTA